MSALAFLTIFGRATPPRSSAFAWFPVVGTAIGASLAGVWLGATELWHPLLAATIVVVADVVITGALHYDGLADSADGLLPHLDPERRLQVMRAPDVGAFAVVTVTLVLLVRVGAIAAPAIEWWMFPVVAGLSRTVVATVPAFVTAARPDSIGAAFAAGARGRVLYWLAPLTAIAATFGAGRGLALAVATVAGSTITIVLARKRIGGWTGDVLGAAIVLGETVGLLVAAAEL